MDQPLQSRIAAWSLCGYPVVDEYVMEVLAKRREDFDEKEDPNLLDTQGTPRGSSLVSIARTAHLSVPHDSKNMLCAAVICSSNGNGRCAGDSISRIIYDRLLILITAVCLPKGSSLL